MVHERVPRFPRPSRSPISIAHGVEGTQDPRPPRECRRTPPRRRARELGQLGSVGLRHIKDAARFETENAGLFVLLKLLVIGASFSTDHWSKDHDALLALADLSAQRKPEMETADARCLWALAVDEKNVKAMPAVSSKDFFSSFAKPVSPEWIYQLRREYSTV
jgi:hypothetical protein